ncbi:MAG TPA: nuclear transport factor 2 family protein [Gammaproteobacteria bacterium]|nr:nuclear transport factor 2 family protein [Gammaproteobacteria bacterium]
MTTINVAARSVAGQLGLWLAAATLALGAASGARAQSASEIKQLEIELAALSDRIERLQDLSEVEIVQRAYGYYVDKSLWYDLADLWTEDGTLEIGGRGVFLGRDRVFEYMNVGLGAIGPKPGVLVDHQQFQPIVTINPDGKTAEMRAIAFVMSGGGWGHVYYENDYVKENGVWKMAKLHGPFNMYSGYDIGWLNNTTLNTFPEKFPPPPDLPPTVIYLTFPNYYVEPFHYPNPVTGEPMPPPDRAAGGAAFGSYED